MLAYFEKLIWENESRSIATFYFRPETTYRYEAGQYATLSVSHDNADNRGIRRTMTLSSSPHENLLAFTMRVYKNRGSSYKQALLALQPGGTVTIDESLGDLVLPLDSRVPIVYVAGGVGIASYIGMVKWLLHTGDARAITLLYAAASTGDIVLQKPFDKYAARYGLSRKLYISGASASSSTDQKKLDIIPSRLSPSAVLEHILPESLVYISGPESMVEQLRTGLKDVGIPSRQIVFDYFDGYTGI